MNDVDLMMLRERFDDVVLRVLEPVHMRKSIDEQAIAELRSVLDELRAVLGDREQVPREFVGHLWFVFTSMLGEADHAKNPTPILDAAWDIQERLRRIFGPTW